MAKDIPEHELRKMCKKIEEHQGFTNKETFSVSLMLTNTESLYNRALTIAKENLKNAAKDENVADKIWTECEAAKFRTADALKDWLEDENPLVDKPSSIHGQLVTDAMSRVNFDELAQEFLDMVDEQKKCDF